MNFETSVPRSRRAILAATLGGVAGLIGAALGRPAHVEAEGESITVGGDFDTATSATSLINKANNNTVLWAESQANGGATGGGLGVVGTTVTGVGVSGRSSSDMGVAGQTSSTTAPAVRGHALGNSAGVFGYSGGGVPSQPKTNTGVHGYANQDAAAIGVFGQSGLGTGVQGQSASGVGSVGLSTAATGATVGVFGRSDSSAGIGVGGRGAANSTGVSGYSGAGTFPAASAKTGVYGEASQDSGAAGVRGKSTSGRGVSGDATSGAGLYGHATTGYALRAAGRVKFDQASGLLTIAAGHSSATTAGLGFDVNTSTKVLATLQSTAGGKTTIKRIARNTTSNTITVYLTAAATQSCTVAWLALS